MSTYATTDEVKAEFKNLDTSSSGAVITNDKIDGFRTQAYAYIHARIGHKYVTPVPAATDAFTVLKQVETWLVKHRIQQIVPVRTGADGVKQGDSKQTLEQKADAVLDQIAEGKMKLGGATLASSADGVSSFSVADGCAHVVKKDRDQW